jgi:hypothetical protein
MAFAPGLRRSLLTRQGQVPAELDDGDGLERVLNRHLMIVEEMADRELLTAIFLVDGAGQRLRHGAAPSLPADFCRALDGISIGPSAGSCGTAAYLGQAIYVPDIATDPLWAKHRDLASSHQLRACWSTPLRDADDAVIGTFAIFHRSVGSPTSDEIKAIEMITEHVAHAIMWAQDSGDLERPTPAKDQIEPALRLVDEAGIKYPSSQWRESLLESVARLEAHVDHLDRCAAMTASEGAAQALRASVIQCRRLISVIRAQLESDGLPDRHR